MSWYFHIEEIIPKLNQACFAIRSIWPYLSYEVGRWFIFIFTLLSYGIIFWGNSSQNTFIFQIQKEQL